MGLRSQVTRLRLWYYSKIDEEVRPSGSFHNRELEKKIYD